MSDDADDVRLTRLSNLKWNPLLLKNLPPREADAILGYCMQDDELVFDFHFRLGEVVIVSHECPHAGSAPSPGIQRVVFSEEFATYRSEYGITGSTDGPVWFGGPPEK